MKHLARYITCGILVLSVLVNLIRFLSPGIGSAYMLDFKNVYVGSTAYAKGQDPYRDENLKAGWKETADRDNVSVLPAPGLPENPFLYPPAALSLFYPLASLSFPIASGIWMGLNLLFIVGILFMLSRLGGFERSTRDVILLVLVFLSLKSTHLGLLVGQPLYLSYFLCLLAMVLERERSSLSAGIVLGLGFFKYTVAFPFGIYFLMKKRFRILGIAMITIVGTNLVGLWGIPGQSFLSYVDLVSFTTSPGQCNDFTPLNPQFYDLTLIHTLLYNMIPDRSTVLLLGGFMTLVLAISPFTLKKYDFRSPEILLVFFTFFTLLFVHHRFIDSLILMNIFLVYKPWELIADLKWKILFIIPMMFPVTGFFLKYGDALPESLGHWPLLNIQLSLVIVFLIWFLSRRRTERQSSS